MARAAIVAVLLLVLVPASPVGADSWPGPRVVSVFSENGDRFVRIVPGASVGDTVGFAGAPRGAYARGEFYARQPDRSYRLVADVPLANPVAPVEALVSNGGHLLTLDNWHNLGHGPVVAVYGPSGSLLRSYRLEELYDARRLASIPTSVSSRWWRCAVSGFVDPPTQAKVYVTERLGGTFVVTLPTAAIDYQAGAASCQAAGAPVSATFHP